MRSVMHVMVGITLLFVLACGAPEEQILGTFFTAVQGGDEDVLQQVSLAPFTGDVQSWEIVEVGPESQAPFGLSELYEKMAKLKSELRIETQKNAHFANDNRSLFEEYKEKHAEDSDYEFTGELADFQAAWEERMKRQGELEKEVEALEEQMQELRAAANLSLNTSVNENFAGDVKGKEVTLRVNDGSSEKNYTFTLRRYELADTARNITPIARWIITDIKEQA